MKARKRIHRTAAVTTAAATVVAGGLAVTGTASADSSTTFTMSPTSGSMATTFSITPPQASCPTGDLGWSLKLVTPGDESDITPPSGSVSSALRSDSQGSLSLVRNTSIGTINDVDLSASGLNNIVTQAGSWSIALRCFNSGATAYDEVWYKTVTFNGAASSTSTSWTTSSSTSSAVGTTTSLQVSPSSPAASGSAETLTATVAAASGSAVPAGSVAFMDGSTQLASVAVGSNGVATSPADLADGSHTLTAVFTPAESDAFSASTSSAVSYTVSPASSGGGTGGSESVTVTIPSSTGTGPGGGQGQLALTVAPNAAESLTVNPAGTSATGFLTPVYVTDTRASSPGWTVSGQASDFTGTAGTIPDTNLGWTPDVASSTGTVTAGPAVAAGSPGLGSTTAVLGTCPGGDSTATLGAQLNLTIPSGQASGTYNSTITITAI